MATNQQHEMKYYGGNVQSSIHVHLLLLTHSTLLGVDIELCIWVNYPLIKYVHISSNFEKHTVWWLTSFLRSLLSLCRCHLMTACGERAWHSRKVLLPSTPYCTISRVFLLAAGQRDTGITMATKTLITMSSFGPKISVVVKIKVLFFCNMAVRDYHKAARISQ